MPRMLVIFLTIFTALLIVGVYLIVQSGDGPAQPPEEKIIQKEVADQTDLDDPLPINPREIIEPSLLSMSELDEEMPASYREALGLIKGRIVEHDGAPIPNIKVEIYGISALEFIQDIGAFMDDEPPELAFRFTSTTTDEEGVFSFKEIYPRAFYMLGIDLGGSRATSRIIDALPGPGEVKDLGDIVLAAHAVLIGKIVDENNKPVSDVRIRATDLPSIIFISGLQNYREGCSFLARMETEQRVFDMPHIFHQFSKMLPIPTTETKSDGSFRLEGVPLGRISLVADRVEYLPLVNGPISTVDGGEKDLGDIVIRNGVLLKGKVLDCNNKPVENVEVRVGPMYTIPEFIILQPPVKTNEKGAFVFPGAESRSTFAAARRYEQDSWTIVGPFHPDDQVEIVLPVSYDVRLNLVREDSEPVEEPKVKIKELMDFGEFLPFSKPKVPKDRMQIHEGGVVDINSLPPGDYQFMVSAKGCGVTTKRVSIRETPVEKEVVLKLALKADVLVLTEKKNKPVEWAEVYVVSKGSQWFLDSTKLARSRTDHEGKAVLNNLIEGEYTLTASHPKYAVTGTTLRVPSNEETVILVKAGGILAGVVHQGGSTEEAPYMIALALRKSDEKNIEAYTPRLTVTDLDGEFRVTNLHPGEWRVHVLKRVLDQDPLGLGEVMRKGPLKTDSVEIFTEETSFLEFNLLGEDAGPKAHVSGSVMVNNKPAFGAVLTMYAKKRFEATTDTSGRFNFGKVPVGKHNIRIVSIPGPTGDYEFRIGREIEVEENIPLYANFNIFTGTIFGTVINENTSNPIGGVKVTATLEDDAAPYTVRMSTASELDGSFIFDGVPIGIYSIRAREKNLGCEPTKGVKLSVNSRVGPVVVKLKSPVMVSGFIELPESASDAPRIFFMAGPKEGGRRDRVWIKVDMETRGFETTKLVPGFYTGEVYTFNKKQYTVGDFEVPHGGVSNLVLTAVEKIPEIKNN